MWFGARTGERGEGDFFFRAVEMSSVMIATVATRKTICQEHQTVHVIVCKLYFMKLIYRQECGCNLEPRSGWTRILKEVGINICVLLVCFLLKDILVRYY